MATSEPESGNGEEPAQPRGSSYEFRMWPDGDVKPMSKNRYKELMQEDQVEKHEPQDQVGKYELKRGHRNRWSKEEEGAKTVIRALQNDEIRKRMSLILRNSIDQVVDWPRTGRWRYQHLAQPEKTYLGTAIQVNMEREIDAIEERGTDQGKGPDWTIQQVDVDCKFSSSWGKWMIPMEMYKRGKHPRGECGNENQVALLLWADDDNSKWAAGIVLVKDQRLMGSLNGNRDGKRMFSKNGLEKIYWLWGGIQTDLPKNPFLEMSDEGRKELLKNNEGLREVGELKQHFDTRFKEKQQQLIARATAATNAEPKEEREPAFDARQKDTFAA